MKFREYVLNENQSLNEAFGLDAASKPVNVIKGFFDAYNKQKKMEIQIGAQVRGAGHYKLLTLRWKSSLSDDQVKKIIGVLTPDNLKKWGEAKDSKVEMKNVLDGLGIPDLELN